MLEKGTFVADRYEILEKVGVGGMADVYKAKDRKLGRYVAIKVLKQEFSEDINFVTKFRTEAQSAAGLEHPNIVNIYDVGSEHGFYYIVMEFVEGITLKDYIKRKGRLNYKEALSIAIQVSRGIQAAHEKHIIHRDIKPQNIIISTDGKVKVTDFGIARAATTNTIHSDVMGSVHYASPEQARNGYVSERSDIYSLGIVMYEMVTGRVPFDGDSTVQIAIQHLQDEIVNPRVYAPDLPVSLEKIILKCTQKSPDRRYDSVDNLLIDLRRSLINPNEDFVTNTPVDNATRVISEEELRRIQNYRDRAREEEEKPQELSDETADYDDLEDGRDNGRPVNSKTERIVTIMGIIAAVILVIIVVMVLRNSSGLFHSARSAKTADNSTTTESSASEENSSQKDTVSMPDLRGMTVSQAESRLKSSGISVHQSGIRASSEYDEGQIVEQDVDPKTRVESGTTVNVVVSSGASNQEKRVTSVIGLSEQEAVSALESQGFVVDREYEYSDSVGEGEVSRQSPQSGETANEGDTVTIYVSRGSEQVRVPSVTGEDSETAQKTLTDAGFKVETKQEYSSDVEKGNVISQSVNGGEYADKDSTITLTISRGEKNTVYSYSETISPPDDLKHVTSANIQLYSNDTDSMIKEWTGVTKFPKTLKVGKIRNSSSGTLVITWIYKDSDGNTQREQDEREATFTKVS